MRRKFATAAAAAIVIALAATACSGQPAAGGSSTGGTLALATVSPPQSWQPGDLLTGPEIWYTQPVYDSLLRNDNEGEPVANVATEWSYNDDSTVLSLKLRDDVKFTDGTALDGEAVKANLESAKTGSGGSATQLRFIEEVTVVDPTAVDIKLSAPDPSFLPSLGGPAGMMASPSHLEDGSLATTPVGSGPYTLSPSTQAGSKYVYTRNADYWNQELYPYDEITATIFNDKNAMLNALRAGQVNVANVEPKDVESVSSSGQEVVSFPSYNANGLYLFDREGTIVPALGDVRVRQAINYALDRQSLFDQLYDGKGAKTAQMFSVDSTAYLPELEERYPYDVDKAKELMAEAGYADGFVLPMPDVSPIYPSEQAAVTEALAAIGITTEYQPVNGEQFISDLLGAKYPAAIFRLDANRSWDTTQIALDPDALWNTFHVNDPKIVELITKAQGETGDEQAKTFQELNTYVVEQAWFAPWIQGDNSFGLSSGVTAEGQKYSTFPPIWNIQPTS